MAVLAGLAAFWAWSAWAGWRTGEIHMFRRDIARGDAPVLFWLAIAMVALWAAAALLALAVLIWEVIRGDKAYRRVDAYLQKRADEGGRASAIPPRLR